MIKNSSENNFSYGTCEIGEGIDSQYVMCMR